MKVLNGLLSVVLLHILCVCVQKPVMSEEVNLIVESLLSVLLRTILEISNRPQTPASTMRPQSQDVTVREQR